MKVKALIEALLACDPERDVVVSGYEGGYVDVTELREFEVACDVNDEWWYGPHEAVDCLKEGEHPRATRKQVVKVH